MLLLTQAYSQRVDSKLDGLHEAIADGLRTLGLKAKLEELEQHKEELDLRISDAPPPVSVLHPYLAELYRRSAESLHARLDSAESRTDAAEIIRGLVERIRVRNPEEGIEIELVG